MTLTEGSLKHYAFIPLLESHFRCRLILPEDAIFVQLRSYIEDTFLPTPTSNYPLGGYLTIGFANITGKTTILFIHTVADVIALSKSHPRNYIFTVVTNLVTHLHELRKLGYDTELIKIKVPQLKFSGLANKWQIPGSGIFINPTSTTEVFEMLKSKAFVQFKEAYEPGDDNYANEYNEIYQLANIFKVPVYTAITHAELETITELIKYK